jgi:hypothetical protein
MLDVLDIEESAAALASDAAGVAVAVASLATGASLAAAAVESAELSVLLAGCEHPARARPAMAARMATVEPIGARRAVSFEGDMRSSG